MLLYTANAFAQIITLELKCTNHSYLKMTTNFDNREKSYLSIGKHPPLPISHFETYKNQKRGFITVYSNGTNYAKILTIDEIPSDPEYFLFIPYPDRWVPCVLVGASVK